MGWDSLLDDWADRGIRGGLRRRPVFWRPLRPEAGEPGHLAQDGLHCRSGGGDPLLHHLLAARPAEGCHVLHLWAESYAVLGLRRGLHARAFSQHLDTLSARCSDRVGRLSAGDLAHGRCRGGGAGAVLLPEPAPRKGLGGGGGPGVMLLVSERTAARRTNTPAGARGPSEAAHLVWG